MVGIAALQAKLRVNSDVAKQRSEAVRIARGGHRELPRVRHARREAACANNLAYAGCDQCSRAEGRARQYRDHDQRDLCDRPTVVDSTQTRMKDLRVSVAWTNRDGVAESVVLRSVIAGIDPLLAAAMTIAPNGSPVRDALGRDIQIPIPAKNLGNGTSIFKPVSNGTTAYLFNNDSGMITKKCTGIGVAEYTAALTATAVSVLDINAMLLSGYVRTSLANNPDAATPNDVPPGALSIRLDLEDDEPPAGTKGTAAQLTAAFWPTAAEAVRQAGYTVPECGAEDSKTVRFTTPVNFEQVNNGVTQNVNSTTVIAIVPAATALNRRRSRPMRDWSAANVLNPVATGERFIAYTCVVYPRAFAGGLAWTGRSMLVPSGWTIGAAAAEYKVCRYSEDYNLNGYVWTAAGGNITKIENGEHPYAYLLANGGLQNQNFLIIKGNKQCPTDGAVEVDGTGGENYTNETTVIHQQ